MKTSKTTILKRIHLHLSRLNLSRIMRSRFYLFLLHYLLSLRLVFVVTSFLSIMLFLLTHETHVSKKILKTLKIKLDSRAFQFVFVRFVLKQNTRFLKFKRKLWFMWIALNDLKSFKKNTIIRLEIVHDESLYLNYTKK